MFFFATNSLPHIIPGVHGKPFYSPFAKPPVKGKSSAVVNVLWGFFNIVVAYVIFVAAGINLRDGAQGAGFLLGILITSLILAITFGANNKREE
ncbi:MAG: hypothetical protein SNH18_04810 [Rikenellaceae bacterium]